MKQIIEKLRSAQAIAILSHISEDADAIGSCLAMAHMLKKTGKNATIYVNDAIEDRLAFLGNDYVIYNEDTEVVADLCVCLDCGDIKRLGERASIVEKIGNSINIDHHYSNTNYADVNYVEGNASSTGEVIYKLFMEMNIELDDICARYLYAAICSDTGSFKFSSVSPETMHIAAKLMEYNIEHDKIARALFDTYTIEEIKLRAQVMSTIESYGGGKINVVCMNDEMLKKYGIEKKNTPSVVDIARGVAGGEIAIALIQNKDEIRVNLRSNEYANVSEIAAKFGGGGHIRAAGCRVKNTDIEELKKQLIQACLLAI